MRVPFLKPKVVPVASYQGRLQQIDAARWYTNFGPQNELLEQRVLAEVFEGVGAVLTVTNATLGLMLAIRAARRPGRFALMPSFTFAATALAAQWNGMTPFFFDVRADDWCPDEQQLQVLIRELGDEVGVVVTYSTFGTPMSLSGYAEMHRSKVPVVVDAAPSLGAGSDDGPFGSRFPGPVIYSLHATKAFAVGEGGLVYSADTGLVQRIRRMSNFGFDDHRSSIDLGLNAKMPEVLAAIGLSTLDRMPAIVSSRRRLYDAYKKELRLSGLLDRGWQLQRVRGQVPHQFMPVLARPGLQNTSVIAELADSGIAARTYFSPPCHRQPQFADCPRASLSVTEDLAGRAVSLPLWEDMPTETLEIVVEALAAVDQQADR